MRTDSLLRLWRYINLLYQVSLTHSLCTHLLTKQKSKQYRSTFTEWV